MSGKRKRRTKRFRRLMILMGVLCVVGGLSVWLYRLGVSRNRAVIADMRRQAIAAYAAGDYPTSVSLLGQYLQKSRSQDTDSDAVLAYGKSRLGVEMPGMQQVYEGIQILERSLAAKSADPQKRAEARRTLLTLYVQAGYQHDAIKLADEYLATDPDDVEAMRAKVQALEQRHDLPAALTQTRAMNERAPLNLWGQRETVYLLRNSGASRPELLDHAAALRRRHPGDPRFEILTAYTYGLLNEKEPARQWLRTAAAHPLPDAESVSDLVMLLNENDLFAESAGVLRRAADVGHDAAVERMLVRRLWQDGRLDEVLARTDRAPRSSKQVDSESLGYRALALRQRNRPADADAIVKELATRTSDAPAAAWAEVLRARFTEPPVNPREFASHLRRAIARDSSLPALHQMLAEAYAKLGETEPAIVELRQVNALDTSWAAPHAFAMELFTRTGRYNYALDTAIAARLRAPGRYETEVAHALALYRFATAVGRTRDYAPLLDEIRTIQGRWKETSTIPAQVHLLILTGQREPAMKAAKAAMTHKPALPADVLLQLAVVSDRQNLGLAPAFRQLARNAHGLTPDIALAQARALEAAGQADRGLQLLLDGSKGQKEMKAWRLAIAQYREETKDPQVLVDWEALGQQYPDDLAVQTAITYAPSRVRDRQFWLETIGRLKAITGEEGMEWRAERSRWLLAASEMTEKDKSEALKLLGEVASTATALPEPHRLLAKVLEKVPDLPRAIGEWQAAYNLRPDEPMYVTGLIQALMSAGRGAEALPYLDRLARNNRLDPETRHWTASQFASVGQTDRAIELLKSEPPSRERDALLAEFDRRLGRSAASLGPQARSNPG